jgi:preprotein translocase subunit SecD
LQLDPGPADRDAAVAQTVKILQTRLNAYGVNNFLVTPQSNGRILLDLSAEKDPERLKAFITAGGKLELTHVISPASPAPVQTYPTKEEAIASLNSGGTVPTNRRVLLFAERDDADDPPGGASDIPRLRKWVVVESPPIVSGSDLRTASAVPSPGSQNYEIVFSLTPDGAQRFGSWTGANVNEYLGVVLNDQVKSIAFIKSQIMDSGVIAGRFTKESAEDLALVLKSGALPAAIKIVDERIDK